MLRPVTRTLLIGGLWLATVVTPGKASAAISAVNDASRAATGEFVTSIGPKIPAVWNVEEPARAGEFTEAVLGDDRSQPGFPEGSAFLSEIALAPVDETRSGAKIPEPVTLVLLGTGLIAIASASRRKRPSWKFGRVAAARIRLCFERAQL